MSGDELNTSAAQVDELCRLVRRNDPLMGLLRQVASLGLAQWCIAAGAVRNLVWDHLHGFPVSTEPTDIDVLFFDAELTHPEDEQRIHSALTALNPDVRWEVVNQARVHTYTGDAVPYRSIAEAMSRWVDPVTAVGVCLGPGESISVVAPFGLDDLFSLVVRPHLLAPRAADIYRGRIAEKQWATRWPKLRIITLPNADEGADAADCTPRAFDLRPLTGD